jgi:hypothetical protein
MRSFVNTGVISLTQGGGLAYRPPYARARRPDVSGRNGEGARLANRTLGTKCSLSLPRSYELGAGRPAGAATGLYAGASLGRRKSLSGCGCHVHGLRVYGPGQRYSDGNYRAGACSRGSEDHAARPPQGWVGCGEPSASGGHTITDNRAVRPVLADHSGTDRPHANVPHGPKGLVEVA